MATNPVEVFWPAQVKNMLNAGHANTTIGILTAVYFTAIALGAALSPLVNRMFGRQNAVTLKPWPLPAFWLFKLFWRVRAILQVLFWYLLFFSRIWALWKRQPVAFFIHVLKTISVRHCCPCVRLCNSWALPLV